MNLFRAKRQSRSRSASGAPFASRWSTRTSRCPRTRNAKTGYGSGSAFIGGSASIRAGANQAWTGKHDENGQVFPADIDGDYAWSAAFISYVMRLAGAGSSFPYSETHSDYIDAAARHDPGVALVAEPVTTYAPQLGDLICLWRGGQPKTFDELPAGRFPGHCDIVVAIKPGLLDVIGGNVENAVSMKYIPVTADGHLAMPDGTVIDPDHHWFVVLKVLYQRDGSSPPATISAAPFPGRGPA